MASPAPVGPVFVLAPHRSYTSVVVMVLGQHPMLFGLPETNLFVTPTIGQWLRVYRGGRHPGGHGLLRALSEVLYGAQGPEPVTWARHWLFGHRDWPGEAVFALLAARISPLGVVEKSPQVCYRPGRLQRLAGAWPGARYLHVTRHPYSQGSSMLSSLADIGIPPRLVDRWLGEGGDPQRSWLAAQNNILAFEQSVPTDHWLRIRGEDLVADLPAAAAALCDWLGLPGSAEVVERMLHPERSPFAAPGPPGARLGLDAGFLAHPQLSAGAGEVALPSMDDPPPWAADRAVDPQVRQVAIELGYS
ncbi:sulfotransferase [Microlunatus sp. Gsoil 973]|uniref:sulfotransferase family protein n=1 Tax=Microlunatus sp. Gsoil 973 TaxID=2672569 RepID=UPI0012B4D477|nr:sulfotransferase [Microlunatus sp. Gsoil 973]QGN32430.1 sulfotransferase [Microlunatus sp. Gsoil 973]